MEDDERITAIHEAGHAVARYLIHGTTGAIRPTPAPGKAAASESEPLPCHLRGALARREYIGSDRTRLLEEIQTTLAGPAAEAAMRGKPTLDVLEEPPQRSDCEVVYGVAGLLWTTPAVRDREVARIASEMDQALSDDWALVEAVATAYLRDGQLTADDVRQAIESVPG
jgi:hypothetical protein